MGPETIECKCVKCGHRWRARDLLAPVSFSVVLDDGEQVEVTPGVACPWCLAAGLKAMAGNVESRGPGQDGWERHY